MNCSNSDNEKEGTFNSYDILITVGINSLIPLLFFLVFVNLINFTNLGWYNLIYHLPLIQLIQLKMNPTKNLSYQLMDRTNQLFDMPNY